MIDYSNYLKAMSHSFIIWASFLNVSCKSRPNVLTLAFISLISLSARNLGHSEVSRVHLFEEYEGEHSVGPEASVVRQEALPERQNSFVLEEWRHHPYLALPFSRVLYPGNDKKVQHKIIVKRSSFLKYSFLLFLNIMKYLLQRGNVIFYEK